MNSEINPLKSLSAYEKLTEEGTEALREAKRQGRPIAWGSGYTEVLQAMDITVSRAYAERLRRAGLAPMFIDAAEAEGYSSDICSYITIETGLALYLANGWEDRIPEPYRIPKPDFIVQATECQPMGQRGEVLADIFGVPLLLMEMPFTYDPAHWQRDMTYGEQQLADIVSYLEEATGRTCDWDRLRRYLEDCRVLKRLGQELDDLAAMTPTPISFTDVTLCGSGFNARLPLATLTAFYERVRDELRERVANGIGAVSPERHRLLWRGMPPRGEEDTVYRMLASRGAVAAGGYQCDLNKFNKQNAGELPPDGIDLERPLLTVASDNSRRGTRPFKWRMEREIYKYSRFHHDGVIFFSSRTCRPYSIMTSDMADEVEKQLGLPTTIIEGDHCDPQYFSPAQVETRLQAFVETLDARHVTP